MSKFTEYLEQTGSIKKEVINESYKVEEADPSVGPSEYLSYDDEALEEHELENIAEFLNLLEQRKEKLYEWIKFFKTYQRTSLETIRKVLEEKQKG